MRTRGFRWTAATGVQDLGSLPGTVRSSAAYGTDATGAFVVGSSAGGTLAAVRFGPGGIDRVPPSFGVQTFAAQDVSADGTVVVGYQGITDTRWKGFRWTPSGGTQTLESLSASPYDWASAVSADGSVAVGTSQWFVNGDPVTHAVWWDARGRVNDIGRAPGQVNNAYGMDVSADGRVVLFFGYSTDAASSDVYLFDRVASRTVRVVRPPEWDYASADRLSACGTFLTGQYLDPAIGDFRAFVAGPGRPMEDLLTALRRVGAPGTEGWVLIRATGLAVLPSEVVVSGIGIDPQRNVQAFRATLPRSLFIRPAWLP